MNRCTYFGPGNDEATAGEPQQLNTVHFVLHIGKFEDQDAQAAARSTSYEEGTSCMDTVQLTNLEVKHHQFQKVNQDFPHNKHCLPESNSCCFGPASGVLWPHRQVSDRYPLPRCLFHNLEGR